MARRAGRTVQVAQGRDYGGGVLRLKRPWYVFGRRQLHLDYDIAANRSTFDAIARTHARLARATGGTVAPSFMWSAFNSLITPHPLGGCNMGDPPGQGTEWTDVGGRRRRTDQGVVDHRGQVFGHRNLYVADGAIIPRSLGRNPALTIAALAERISDKILD